LAKRVEFPKANQIGENHSARARHHSPSSKKTKLAKPTAASGQLIYQPHAPAWPPQSIELEDRACAFRSCAICHGTGWPTAIFIIAPGALMLVLVLVLVLS